MKKLVICRMISQGVFLALFLYILWSTTYPLSGAISPEIIFTLDPLIILATSLAERMVLAGFAAALVLFLAAFVLGRFFCGWICPLGTMIDMTAPRKKRKELDDTQNRKVRKIKFIVLTVLFLCALAGFQLAWVFDPVTVAARFVSLNLIPTLTLLIDGFFSWTIRIFGLYGPVYDLYRSLKGSFLGVKVYYFSHALFIFVFFLAILYACRRLRRGWCRAVCPLGALYAIAGRSAFLKRRVNTCSRCMKCRSNCRMGAIRDDLSYAQGECILCMDCVYDCPAHSTRFSLIKPRVREKQEGGITRRNFLVLAAASFLSSAGVAAAAQQRALGTKARVIRPPASLEEAEFVNRCIRCGNCMKVCVTNGLQPALLESGASGIWTPRLVPEIGYCEYHCTLCGRVCPTGAIPRLTEQQKLTVRLGIAWFDRTRCLPWKENKPCLVCEEHCPVSPKAIRLKEVWRKGKRIALPYMIPRLCVGCGICQTKCPVRPVRAITVFPVRSTHADKNGKVITGLQ